jgi:hypothetical protein
MKRAGMLRRNYGGSYVSRGSHNDTRLPLNKSAQTAQRLGILISGSARIEGKVGPQSGAASRFYEFETDQPLRIRLRPVELNAFESPKIQWALRRVDGGDGQMLESLQLVARNQEGTGQPGFLISPGRFHIIVSTSSWYEIPFACELDLREVVTLQAPVPVELDVEIRLNYPLWTPATGVAVEQLGKEFEVEVSGNLLRTVLLPTQVFYSYVRDGYWVNGYTLNDEDSVQDSQLVTDFDLELVASLSVTTPSSL